MDTSTFITIMPQGQLWALLNACWWASNIYATTGRILFYLLCTIISEHYINIKIELDSLAHNIASDNSKIQFSAMADRLSKLADKYALVYECVEQLNISFGHFLLFDITCIFVNEINSTMYLLTDLYSVSSDWLSISIAAMWNIYGLINFSLLCFSSHRIGNDVSVECIDALEIKSNQIYKFFLNAE